MFVALFECLFVLRGALSYPGGVGAVARPVPGSGVGGAGGGDRWTGPQDRGGARWLNFSPWRCSNRHRTHCYSHTLTMRNIIVIP